MDTNKDFFSYIVTKLTGIQQTFLVIGGIWLIGTLLGLSNPNSILFVAWALVWLGFVGMYKACDILKIKSSATSVILLILVLFLWKATVGVSIRMMMQ